MPKIERLTQAQIDRMPEFVDKWVKIGLSTEPADRLRAERSIRLAYENGGRKPPLKIVWATSPFAKGLIKAFVFRMRESVRESVRQSVRQSVGESVRESVGHSVGQSVRQSVGESVRQSVGQPVRESVGESVRQSVGQPVRQSVRQSVWQSVGESVRESVWESGYGQHDAEWLAFYDFFREVCGLVDQTAKLEGLVGVARSAGWYLPHENICWISERHHRVYLNSQGQLHSHDGMAVQYPDGWGVWAWNGVRVNEQIILHADTLTPEQIAKESNAQVRQVMVERIGVERVCQMFHATEQDRQGDYRLLLLDLGDGRKRPYLKMLNPSVGVWHVEGVHPNCATVQEALNWRNGLTPAQIDAVNGADWIQQGDVILKPQGATKLKPQPIQLT